ncbi:GNAT family N-acetyltransferase [Nocardioides sp. zg-1230]|uniref:GNAT family N-acetyltransferase n=1 Tax=Nocardioides sp. zg-1230 TaxID=2736601 RepID=UPI001C130668
MFPRQPATVRSPSLALPHHTARLSLRSYTVDDVDDSLAYYASPTVVTYVPWEPWTRAEAQRRIVERIKRTQLDGPGSALSLVVELQGRLIGDVVLWPVDETMSRGEMGWAFDPEAGGHGYATEAVHALMRIAFETYGMHRVLAHVDPRNEASLRLCERVGMRREGHLRENAFIKDEWVDSVVFGALAAEWLHPSDLGEWNTIA